MPYEDYSNQQYSNSPFPFLDSANKMDGSSSDPRSQTMDPATFSDGVQFQLPHFMCSTAPTLAPGGGAEVLSAGMLNNASWLINNGFNPRYQEPSFYKTPSPIQQVPCYGQQQHVSNAAPFDFEDYPDQPIIHPQSSSSPSVLSPSYLNDYLTSAGILPNPPVTARSPPRTKDVPSILPPPSLTAASTLGLPVYSASGFDLLSILSRVATRPYPSVHLGPVDLTCSFVVVDTRRHDHPIVYCSPSFSKLTGYAETEILGRNCRFLQSPTGQVEPGSIRQDTSQTAVSHLKKSLSADKECQTIITNYRKDGFAFMNLVTVIPIHGGVSGAPQEEHDVVFHVGFQVDLTEQPSVILEKLRNGSYVVDYGSQSRSYNSLGPHHGSFAIMQGPAGPIGARERKSLTIPPIVISKDLKRMLADPAFVRSIPLTTCTTVPLPLSGASADGHDGAGMCGGNQLLHLMLLEMNPDFIHVVSLKGSFLYVAPSVRRVLGYEPEEMVGGSIADFTHPEDVVPLMRELKESSATGISAAPDGASGYMAAPNGQIQVTPRSVDLLFRARTKSGVYVWVECRGRLHVEPGKGRKAIVLSGRAKEMPKLTWDMVARAGGLARTAKVSRRAKNADGTGKNAMKNVEVEQEFWGTISDSMVMLAVGRGVEDVLGWTPNDLSGRSMMTLLVEPSSLHEEVSRLRCNNDYSPMVTNVRCKMQRKDGSVADVYVIIYRATRDPALSIPSAYPGSISPAALIYQIRLSGAVTYTSTTTISNPFVFSPPSPTPLPEPTSNIFEEMETTRESSWQYELQQLRFANQRLLDEISTLEASIQASGISASVSTGKVADRRSLIPKQQGQHQGSTSPPSYAPSQPTAALPSRTSSIMDSRNPQSSSSTPHPYIPRSSSYSVHDWPSVGPSPFVQRVQHEAVVESGSIYYPSKLTPMKRAWSSMDN